MEGPMETNIVEFGLKLKIILFYVIVFNISLHVFTTVGFGSVWIP